MPPAPGHHFNAIIIEDDDLQHVGSQQLEGHHVPDLDLMDGGEGGPTLIKGDPAVYQLHNDPPRASGVRLQLDSVGTVGKCFVKSRGIGMH